ncbi:MAG TPA: helix-turn-helix transcriptional regulator [Verrucomicrobiae bacterium]|nr:helix-turn-helix transcriptional regulator [Verrucomicrobiae bacterium]
MSTVAAQLHQAREARRLTVEQVAEITKIRSDHLRALEKGDFNIFSAPVYIRGFVRTYSTLLKLDVPQIMASLDAELGQTQKFAEPPPLSGPPRGVLDLLMLQLSKVDWRKGIAVVGALVVVTTVLVAVAVHRHYAKIDPLRSLKPAVYHTNPKTSGETVPLPSPSKR